MWLRILKSQCRDAEEGARDLDDFSITVFCTIDEALPHVTAGQRMRQRGPQPTLHDSEVLTMEVVGEYLGLAQETALFT